MVLLRQVRIKRPKEEDRRISQMLNKINEGSCVFYAPIGKVISKKLPVFYNPDMKLNRDICVLLLKSLPLELRIADILAGTGIRSIRLLKEIPKARITSIDINDLNPNAAKLIKKNLKLNKIKGKKISVQCKDANSFLIESNGFNYIDIDPFGSPNPFLDNSIRRLSREGLLAVTATDTSALAGSHPGSCKRKYWATPLRNDMMHEIGIRILIRKVQLIGAQYEKALMPIFCHSTLHYMRVYFACQKSKTAVDDVLKQHGYLLCCRKCMARKTSQYNKDDCCKTAMEFAGPLWLGELWNRDIVDKMYKTVDTSNKELTRLIITIRGECRIPAVGFYCISKLCKILKTMPPKQEILLKKIWQKEADAAITHFMPDALRTSIKLEDLKRILRE